MKKALSVIFLFLILSVITTCSEEDFLVELQYNEAGCYNVWGTSSDLSDIRAFLETKDIKPVIIYRKFIYPPGTVFCEACFCPTGYGVFITVFPKDVKKGLDLGFFKPD